MSTLVSGLLRARARTAGGEPLLTWYSPASGARVELSARTLLNWVDKTHHLLDELGLEEGETVDLPLAVQAPGHWVTAAWQLACWQAGLAVSVGVPTSPALVVTGPDLGPAADARADVLTCSLHPLGLPSAEPLPPGVSDFATEVRAQPDVHPGPPVASGTRAWVDVHRRLTQADLLDVTAVDGRRLVRPSDPWSTAAAAIVGPLLGGGSAVVVEGAATSEQLARITADERAARSEDLLS